MNNNFDGAPLDQAFNIIGFGDKQTMVQKDKEVPRDKTPNELNKVNFENNLKEVKEKYESIINQLKNEINLLKNKSNNNILEHFTNSPEKLNEIILFIFVGVFIIILCNCMFNNGKRSF